MTKKHAPDDCRIKAVGKRRDGGTRYWCMKHQADATAKYGKPALTCRYSHVPQVTREETVVVDIEAYKGGVGIWGAIPPVFDTTELPMDVGIHVHARREEESSKEIDQTFRRVHILSSGNAIEINELDAIYYMVSTVFDKTPQEVICTYCQSSHLDKDWFSVHPHKRHLCAACGKNFRDTKIAIGNPAASVQSLHCARIPPQAAKRALELQQRDFLGGIRIWGSNPAILWTANRPEVMGIHVHAYTTKGLVDIDDTFDAVTIDGVLLDPQVIRVYMAQMALPHLQDRVVNATCHDCKVPAFDTGDNAFTPSAGRTCRHCSGALRYSGRLRKVVNNPLPSTLAFLSANAVRTPRKHDLQLIPETL